MLKISDIIGASSSFIILSLLKHGDSYGYEMAQKVSEYTNGEVKWYNEAIYPFLQKLENQGMVKSYWKILDGERPRKYFSIQDKGLELLEINQREWKRTQELINRLINHDI